MKEVKKYEANDGKIFDLIEEAIAHDNLLEMDKWYEENKLYGNFEGCKIEWETFLEWAKENKIQLKKIIKVL